MPLTILFIANVILAVLHYVYESIYAPTLRDLFKLKLLALRDRLLELHEGLDPDDKDAFKVILASVHSATCNIHAFHVIAFYRARKLLRSDLGLSAYVEMRSNLVDGCKDDTLRGIANSLNWYLLRLLLVNSGGFFFWTWPVFLGIYIVNKPRKIWSTRVTELVRSVLFVPQGVLVSLGHV